MFDIKHQLILFLVIVLFDCLYSKSLRDDKYFYLFVSNNSTEAPGAAQTTYDWGQWTKTTPSGGSQTTYDWGQHTGSGSTYDWGQHTSTAAPNDDNSTDAQGGSKTTYDWGQWTKTTPSGGSQTTYDWGQHTGNGTTYDWGQHTGSRTTYDWGQHTSTSGPNDDNSTTTENPNEGNEYRCPAGKYTCKGTIGLCISLKQICDRKQDCPHRDDEDPKVCFPGFGGNKNKKKNHNNFGGTGFMFNIRNVVIKDKSDAKLFNQQSDNKNTRLIQAQ